MDIREFIKILPTLDEDSAGCFVNDLSDEYRRGAPLETLIPLLTHTDPEIIAVGAWIVSEIADAQRGREVFDELASLLTHQDPGIRFRVIEGVSLLVQPGERLVIEQLFSLAADPDAGVRRQALTYLSIISDSIAESILQSENFQWAKLLLNETSKDEIRIGLRSEELIVQRMAFLGAIRNFGNDQEFLDDLLPYFDEEMLLKLPFLLNLRNGN